MADAGDSGTEQSIERPNRKENDEWGKKNRRNLRQQTIEVSKNEENVK